MTDDLLRRLRDGEPTARTDLFEHCQEQLRPFFRSRLPNIADLDDCVSEVFTRALEGIRAGGQPEVLGAWLIGIAKNLLKQRYEASNRAAELDDDPPQPSGDPQLELARTDLPELPSDLEIVLGKQQLWATLGAATSGLNDGLAAIMRAHITLSVRRKRLVVGAELAATVGMPVDIVNRQLQRSRTRMLDSIAALVLARTGRADCPGLDTTLNLILRPEQRGGDRRLRLDPTQTSEVLKHANGCATCGSRVDEARDYSRWALGPGLLHLADDDEERRRAVLALLDRADEGQPAAQSSAAAVLAAAPAPLGADVPAGIVRRIRGAVRFRVTRLRWVHAVTRFAQENPDTFHRIIAAVSGGAVVVAAIAAAFLANHHHQPEAASSGSSAVTTSVSPPAAVPPHATSPAPAATPVATSPGQARPVAAPLATTTQPAAAGPAATTPLPTTDLPTTDPTTIDPPPPTTTTGSGQDIGIDETDLDYTSFLVSGASGWRDARRPLHLNLAPGTHTLTTPLGQKLTFVVTGDDRVDYDHSEDGTLTGRGTSTVAVHGFSVLVDATDVDYANVTVTATGWPAPQQILLRRLLPGAHSVVTSGGISVPFTVTGTGRVEYAAGVAGLLTGAGGTTLAVHGLPVTINDADLSYANTTLYGTGWRTHQVVRTYRLLPSATSVVTSGGPSLPFTVTGSGRVDYAAGLAGLLTGAGGTTLALHGLGITVDDADLSYDNTTLYGTGWRAHQVVRTYRLWPGASSVVTTSGNTVPFSVTGTGLVGYAAGLEGLLTGAGTTTVAVHGFPITLDMTDLGYANATVSGVAFGVPRPVRTLRLLPGTHNVIANGGYTVPFTVTTTGKVQYDPKPQGILTGAGTTIVAVHGFPITVDVTDLAYGNVTVSGVAFGVPRPARIIRLLPGVHNVITNGGLTVPFTVTATGTVQYDPKLQGILTGAGGTIVAVHGFRITLDVTDVGYENVSVNGVAFGVPRPPRVIRLLPGAHYIVTFGGITVPFRITDTGHVVYDAMLEGVLTGGGTATLAVHGFPVTVDATGSGSTGFAVGGVGSWDARQPRTMRLLPAAHYVLLPTRVRLDFRVTSTGLIDYAPSLDGVLSGRGTSTLTVR